ncbi:glycosyltransferase [Cohnella lubricantis]|uniref:Glycosyltransferase family 2 protein n=1 Tax=Cohnella lubricantis TaxID=2163172 RepID=A0A841TJ22_9BACL|nr:glycosyltransferase [Cohnella lubricantis]MBB6678927.1 glycosyltransferase family 2 protein [Cohnella lubricantis]MBP2120367.1 glycosyltransferase involved in cell wall biosynthesis [Cohnella lubricantis]
MSKLGVSIIACTNRPEYFTNILNNYSRQRHRPKELIIILNNDRIDLKACRKLASRYPHVSVHQVPERISLGQCLNCGISRAKYPLLAKFDHDDYYSPYYLREQVREHVRTVSPIVGKHACLVYLQASKRLVIRSSAERHKYLNFVQGGTILFHRKVLKDVRFPDISLGEDVRFLRRCGEQGHAVYATSPYNYVYIRRKDKRTHTWKVPDRYYLKGSLPVAVTNRYRAFADRKA